MIPANWKQLWVLRIDIEEKGELDAFGDLPKPDREILRACQHLGCLLEHVSGLYRTKLDTIDLFVVSIKAYETLRSLRLIVRVERYRHFFTDFWTT